MKILTKQEAERVIRLKKAKLEKEILKQDENIYTGTKQDLHQQGGTIQGIEGQRIEVDSDKEGGNIRIEK
jgi:hypothetical protein